MEVEIEGLKELEFKTGKSLCFNIVMTLEGYTTAIQGFLYMHGCIFPPSKKVKGKYYPVLYVNSAVGELIYKALERELGKKDLTVKYPLASVKTALEPTWDNRAITLLFPCIIESI